MTRTDPRGDFLYRLPQFYEFWRMLPVLYEFKPLNLSLAVQCSEQALKIF